MWTESLTRWREAVDKVEAEKAAEAEKAKETDSQ